MSPRPGITGLFVGALASHWALKEEVGCVCRSFLVGG